MQTLSGRRERSGRNNKLMKQAVIGLAAPLLFLVLTEGLAFLIFRYPGSDVALETSRQYYLSRVRGLSQFDEGRGRFDPELAYTLQPGTCRFSSFEYDTRLEVNALGFRDDEASLEQPEIIVAGDSHTMGWGVDQQETFAQQLEQLTGRRVLNMGVPSYATVREMIALRRADRRALRYLVLQHCDNDFQENNFFLQAGNTLDTMEQAVFDRQRAIFHPDHYAYYPGKYTREYLPMLFRFYRNRDAITPPPRKYVPEARACLNAIVHGGVDLTGVEIIVLDLAGWGRNTSGFTEAIDRLKTTPAWENKPGIAFLRTLDVSLHLTEAHHFRLDDHLNAKGHAKIAGLLAEMIQ